MKCVSTLPTLLLGGLRPWFENLVFLNMHVHNYSCIIYHAKQTDAGCVRKGGSSNAFRQGREGAQASRAVATVRPHALVQTHLEQLYVLVSKEHLHKIEQELKSIVSANKTLALKVHKLGEKFVRTNSFSCRPVSVYIV